MEMRTPCFLRPQSVLMECSAFCMAQDSVISRSSLSASSPVSSRAWVTWLPRSDCWNWRLERVTDPVMGGEALFVPLARLGAGGAQDPLADRNDQAGELRNRDELSRRYQAQLGVAPA